MKIFLVILALVCVGKTEAQFADEPITPLPLAYSFVSEGADEVKLQGEDVSFRCEVQGIESWQKVSWLNGTLIMYFARMPNHRDPRITLEGEGDVYELKISGVTVQDEGTFTCQISGDHHIEQKYSLTVNIPPQIRMEPEEKSIDLMIGDSVEVSCKVLEGKPAVMVTWSKEDGTTVFENDQDHYIGETLSFEKVDKQHTGNYQCVASNGAGEDVTETIKLNVMYKPNVTVDSNTMYTGPGRTTEITCYFDANPQVLPMWSHDGEDINYNERTNIEPTQKNGEVSLIISNVKEEDLGVYLCKGANEKGEAEAVIRLLALPYGLRILSEQTSYYSDSYHLEWQVESVAELIECNLKVEEVNKSGEYFLGNNTIPAQANAMTYSYQITELHANGTYKLELDCRNAFGSTPTETLEFYTAEQHRPAPPPTTPSPVIVVEEKTEGMKEMNTPDENAKDDPNVAVHPVAMNVANLVLLLMTTLALAW